MKAKREDWEYPEVNRLILLVFGVYVVFWWLEIGLRIPMLLAIRVEFLLGAILGAVALFSFFSRRSQPKVNRDIVGWSIAYILILGFSIPFSLSPDIAYDAYVNRVLKYSVMTLLISQFVVSPTALKFFLTSCFLAFLKIGQESFLAKMDGSQVWESQGVPRLHGIQGSMFGHPNSLSGKTISTLPFLWYLYPALRSRWAKIFILVQVLFAVNIVIFTASRTGYLTVIVMALTLFYFSGKKRRLFSLIAVLTLITVIYTPVEYKERFISSFTGEEASGQSSQTRIDLFHDSVRVFLSNPAGVGIKNFPVAQRLAGRNVQQTHNLYTQLLAETGIQGFICFVGLLIVTLRKALAARQGFTRLVDRLKKDDHIVNLLVAEEIQTNSFLLAVANSLVVFIIVRLVLGVFGHDMLEIYWWLAAGLAMCLSNMLCVAETRVRMFEKERSNKSLLFT